MVSQTPSRTREFDQAVIRLVDGIGPLQGAGVLYVATGHKDVIRSPAAAPLGMALWVVLEEQPISASRLPQPPLPRTPDYYRRLADVLWNCSSAVAAGAAATAGVVAAPVTGGASTLLTFVGGSAAVAASAQCGISIGQTLNEFRDPDLNSDFLDNEDWFVATGYMLDAVQLAAMAAGLPSYFSNLKKLAQIRQATGKSFIDIMRGLSRQERKAVAKELTRFGREKLSKKHWKQLVRAGKLPKIFSQNAINKMILQQLCTGISNAITLLNSARSGVIGLTVSIVQQE